MIHKLPIIIPIKGRGLMHQESGLGISLLCGRNLLLTGLRTPKIGLADNGDRLGISTMKVPVVPLQ